MEPILILLSGSIAAAVLGLIGIHLTDFDNKTVRERLTDAERTTLDNTMLMKEGKTLCPVCRLRYTTDVLCEICEMQVPLLQETIGLEPPVKPADSRSRSGWGYQPLYTIEGFSDLFREEKE